MGKICICSEPFARRGPSARQFLEIMRQAHSLDGLSNERDKCRVDRQIRDICGW